jgi:hypothetical protein
MLAPSSQEHRCLEVKSRTVCRGILGGFLEKQRTAVDTIAWDSERVFKLDLGVFPADERVETNEVGKFEMAKCQTGVLKASRSWGLIGA